MPPDPAPTNGAHRPLVKFRSDGSEFARCPCGEIHGEVVCSGGRRMLATGMLLVPRVAGVCMSCGREWSWGYRRKRRHVPSAVSSKGRKRNVRENVLD